MFVFFCFRKEDAQEEKEEALNRSEYAGHFKDYIGKH